MPGERRHPTAGMAGSKPRARIRKLPVSEIEEASRKYLKERNEMMRLRRMREGMRLGLEREQLISKELAVHQLSFLMIEMRQKLLSLPQRIGFRLRRTVGEAAAKQAADEARRLVHETLETLAKLPLSVEPSWLERLEEEESD